MKTDMEHIWHILDESFDPLVLRTRGTIKRMLESGLCRYILEMDEDIPLGTILWCRFPEFIFFEYLAVTPHARGRGLGAKLMKTVLDQEKCIAVLEVEEPHTEPDRKRIVFYERLGFHLNEEGYEVPPFSHEQPPVYLRVMTHPCKVDVDSFGKMKDVIFESVYHLSL
ncbi:MAG: GNAT family N-acetyltransferase [Synergistaceae bacterium]|nr:GNAT family N-acetyltransferase [Synergistaceae bacterium]